MCRSKIDKPMAENQNIEWKEQWHDEYVKWVCGFANAQGGKIYVGINDQGIVTGITDSKKFLLRKQGKRWDGVPVPFATVKELSKQAFDDFRNKARDAKRLSPEIIREKNESLIEKLNLKTDSNYLKRAALLLFHPDPEKYVTGAFVKIGYFTDDDLVFQDDIHGHLFEQVDKTMGLLLTKYLKATISYKGVQRIEQYPIPEPALREALLNAIAHKDYSSGNPIQIKVYATKIILWNEGQLPDDWTIDRLKTDHPSRPYNPDVANAFFRAGLIEAWGRGTIKIIHECKKAKAQIPVFKYDLSGFVVEFDYKTIPTTLGTNPQPTGTNADKVMALIAANESITIAELAKKIGVVERSIKRILSELQQSNKITRIGSDKTGKWKIISK
jgi:ATP-dependent DNA helicase RecG